MSEALFTYRLRISPRARNVRLRVTVQGGLEVIVPKKYDSSKVPRLLERKREWIRTALKRAEQNRKFFEPKPPWRIPRQIQLQAIGKSWDITAKGTNSLSVSVREIGSKRLLVSGRIQNEHAARAALQRWLSRQTREHLVPRLQNLSARTRLNYGRAIVRRQRTRWASCSRRRNIALNAKLLFLPSDVVDYVMIHELCHLAELNHSRKFWAAVSQNCPTYRRDDAQLRSMWKRIPPWA